MKNNLVEIQELTKIFSPLFPPALNCITATVKRGEIVGVVGADGSGKTTLMRMMAALLLPTKGSIRVNGEDCSLHPQHIHNIIGYMPQKFGLYEDLTVMQNLNLYADLQGVEKKNRSTVFERLLAFTDLSPFKDRLAGNLSGGMKQKLGLACALIKKPILLLLDEPSIGVDPISRRELWKMVYALMDEGISVVWSTAYLDEAERCDRVLLLNEGKLLYHGNPKDFSQRMEKHVFLINDVQENRRTLLRQIISQDNVIDGVIQGREVRVVLADPSKPLSLDSSIKMHSISPRFEDSFVEILGGAPKGASQLAERWPSEILDDKKAIISAEHMTKKFGSFTAVDDITLFIQRGEIFGLLGPNGAGKSTLFKMLCGLLKPTQGTALINGYNLQHAPSQARSQIGYMAQKFSLYTNLTVLQNLEFFAGIYNLRGKKKEAAAHAMIDIFDLKRYLHTFTGLLPLGFKQRLSLACATMHSPPLLFLDEPTSGVDPIIRREFWSHINGLVERGVTVMVTTHFMDEAEYCDRIALVYKGKIITMGTPESLKEKCRTEDDPNPTLEESFIHYIERANE